MPLQTETRTYAPIFTIPTQGLVKSYPLKQQVEITPINITLTPEQVHLASVVLHPTALHPDET